MNEEILALLAKKASLMPQMVMNYPDPENDKVTFPPSPYYRFLKLLAEEIQSSLSVELGVCGGGGSLHLAMSSGQVVGVDKTLEYEDNIRWIKRNYPNFRFYHDDSVKAAPPIYMNYGEIDLLFIDTTHTYAQTMAEYRAYEPILSDKAVICLDDLFREGMEEAWNDIPGNRLRLDFLHPSQSPTDGGFGIIWK